MRYLEHFPQDIFKASFPKEVGEPERLSSVPQVDAEMHALQLQLADPTLPRKERNHLSRKLALLESKRRRELSGDVGRRIPEEVHRMVSERDRGRDFGRANHGCELPGPPHHIRHFETFKGPHTRENPHTPENLEAPCADCHALAHALQVNSGVSVETLFRAISPDTWLTIEALWKERKTYALKEIAKTLERDGLTLPQKS